MRMIHTSDWHLGRSLHGVGLLEAQAGYLDHLVEVVRGEGVDAVVVAGDVYDRAIPPPDAVDLLSQTLLRLRDAGASVILSPGNHDSARRLGFGSPLLEEAGVHIRSSLADVARPVVVDGVPIYPLPYLDPLSTQVQTHLGVETRTHAAVVSAAMERIRADAGTRGPAAVVAAHCFAGEGMVTDSERDISVGGVSMVPASVFDGLSYAALGHLHRPQEITPSVRYCGSPVPMSFSEAGETKGSLLVEVEPDGGTRVETVPAPVHRPLAVLTGTIDELLADPRHAEHERSFVQAVLTDPLRPRGAMDRLRGRFPHVLSLQLRPSQADATVPRRPVSVRGRSAASVCRDFVTDVRDGVAPSEAERRVITDAVDGARRQRDTRQDEGQVEGRGEGQVSGRGDSRGAA